MQHHGGGLRARAIRSLACALGAAALLLAASPAHGKLVEYDYEACPQVPSLHCRHGSTCTPGAASFGRQHDHLGLQTQESGYHCACPPGYVGHECEVEVDDCPLGACYNGAKCQSDGGDSFCDCETANAARGPSDAKFAGTMCQHASTSMCAVSLVGSHAPNHQFCTNHGTCVRLVTSGEPHPGCVCTDGWMGDHCEIRRDPFVASQQKEAQDAKRGKMAVGILIATTVLLAGILTAAGLDVRKRRRAANLNEGVEFKGPSQFTIDDSDGEGEGSGLPTPSEHEADGARASDEAHVVSDDDEDEDEDGGFVPQTELV